MLFGVALSLHRRNRRFGLTGTPIHAETLLTTFAGTFDNLEVLSVWTDEEGTTRLTLMSDDNFLSFQTTQIVEYLLSE